MLDAARVFTEWRSKMKKIYLEKKIKTKVDDSTKCNPLEVPKKTKVINA